MIPEQSSLMDQHDDSTLSHVTSGLSLRYWMRMMEIAQVCKGFVSCRVKWKDQINNSQRNPN
jgi:hypothetical protein